jgi:hypothetical protein
MPDDKLLQAVRLEADKYIPFDVDDVDSMRRSSARRGCRQRQERDEGAAGRRQEERSSPTMRRMLTELGLQPVSSASTASRSATPGSSATWSTLASRTPVARWR